MIVYYSATGNSKYVAETLANKLNDKAIYITDLDNVVVDDEYFGIVCPTYFWTIPEIVVDWLNKVNIKTNSYNFFVSTYGSFTGSNGKDMEKLLNSKGIKLDLKCSIKMPDTWTPLFDVSDDSKNKALLKEADKRLESILELLVNKKSGDYVEDKMSRIITLVSRPLYNSYRKTKNFKVNDQCIGCRKCMEKCPCKAIEMVNNKPKWIKDKCLLCLGCMHRCPKFAITYKNTRKHGQYVNPNTKI